MLNLISSINDLICLIKQDNFDVEELSAICIAHILKCKKNHQWADLLIDNKISLKEQKKEYFNAIDTNLEEPIGSYSFSTLQDMYVGMPENEANFIYYELCNFLYFFCDPENGKEILEMEQLQLGQSLDDSPCVIFLDINYGIEHEDEFKR